MSALVLDRVTYTYPDAAKPALEEVSLAMGPEPPAGEEVREPPSAVSRLAERASPVATHSSARPSRCAMQCMV